MAREIGNGQYSAPILSAIDRCMELRESDRVQSCDELLHTLQSVEAGQLTPSVSQRLRVRNAIGFGKLSDLSRLRSRGPPCTFGWVILWGTVSLGSTLLAALLVVLPVRWSIFGGAGPQKGEASIHPLRRPGENRSGPVERPKTYAPGRLSSRGRITGR